MALPYNNILSGIYYEVFSEVFFLHQCMCRVYFMNLQLKCGTRRFSEKHPEVCEANGM
jgi:hypothetical protein